MKKNKLIYAFIFAVTLFFMGNYTVNAKNLTANIYDSEGNLVPELNVDNDICFTNKDSTVEVDFEKENLQFILFENATIGPNLSGSGSFTPKYVYLVLIDAGFYTNGSTNYAMYNVHVDGDFILQENSAGSIFSHTYMNVWFGSTKDSTTYNAWRSDSGAGYRRTPYLLFYYDGTSWISAVNYLNRPEMYYSNNGKILSASSNVYGNGVNGMRLLYKYEPPIPPDPTEGLTKLELTDSYSVVFKPKYENINSSVDLKFYFLTRHFYDFVWNQNGELFNDLCFAGEELTYRILYDNLDLMNKSDYLEFRRNFNITEEIGSSGGGHGGGSSHSFGETNYNEETNEIEYTKFENAVIYYQPEFFDYCLKKSESSQCYYADGRVEDDYFNIYVSEDYGTGEYIESANKFINEQKNYFSAFGSFAKLGFANLPAGLRNALITIVIISLVEGFIMWLRR